MNNSILEAINNRLVLAINYPPGRRVIEPHAIGYGTDGQVLVRAFQTSGASASGEPEHWKLLRLDRFLGAALAGGTFSGPRPGYKRGDSAMTRGIIAQL